MVRLERGVHQHQHHEVLIFFIETPPHDPKMVVLVWHQHHDVMVLVFYTNTILSWCWCQNKEWCWCLTPTPRQKLGINPLLCGHCWYILILKWIQLNLGSNLELKIEFLEIKCSRSDILIEIFCKIVWFSDYFDKKKLKNHDGVGVKHQHHDSKNTTHHNTLILIFKFLVDTTPWSFQHV